MVNSNFDGGYNNNSLNHITTRVLIEYIPRAGYIEVNESSIYVCINVLCVMRQMYTVCILYRINNIENADNARTQKTLI